MFIVIASRAETKKIDIEIVSIIILLLANVNTLHNYLSVFLLSFFCFLMIGIFEHQTGEPG